MESASSGTTPFIVLSTNNILEGFNQEMSLTSEPLNNELQISISNVHSIGMEPQQPQENKDTNPLDRFTCTECQRYTTTDEEKLTRHIRKVHRGENPFQCFMCDYSTYNKTLFEEHVRIHKGIKPFKCSYCPHRNVSKKNLKRHERIHRPDNPLKCSQCDFIARNKKSYDNHAKKSHSLKRESDLTCDWCGKLFSDEKNLVLHTMYIKTCDVVLVNKKKNIDEKCDYTSCSQYRMKLHKESKHGQVIDKKSKSFMWKCALCTWSSNIRSKILLHLIHHPDQVVDEELIDVSVLRKYDIL